MPFNGSGLFSRIYSWVADRNAAVKIQASRMDAEMDGMATGLSNCVTKDGQTTTSAIIPFSAGIRVSASAPGSPANGDLWITSGGLYRRVDGGTVRDAWEEVASGSFAAATSQVIALTNSTQFKRMKILIDDLYFNDEDAQLALQVSTDNNVSYKATLYRYVQQHFGYQPNGSQVYAPIVQNGATSFVMMIAGYCPTVYTASMEIEIANPSTAGVYKSIGFDGDSTVYVSGTATWYPHMVRGSGFWGGGTDAITHIKLVENSGNARTMSGTYRLLGLRS